MIRSTTIMFYLMLALYSIPLALSAPVVGTPTASPSAIQVATPAAVTVAAQIVDPTVIPTGVNLLRLNANGTSSIIARLNDSGLNGDAASGDKIFTASIAFNEANTGQIRVQVSAAFKGMLKRVMSSIATITVADAASAIGPEGGTLAVIASNSPLFGLSVVVPPHALADKTVLSVTLDQAGSIEPKTTGYEIASLPAFRLSPEGQTFSLPVEITIPYPDSDNDGVVDGTTIPARFAHLAYRDSEGAPLVTVDPEIDQTAHVIKYYSLHFSTWIAYLMHYAHPITITYFVERTPISQYYPDENIFLIQIENAFDQWENALDGRVHFERVYTPSSSPLGVGVKITAEDFAALPQCQEMPTSDECSPAANTSNWLLNPVWADPRYETTVIFNTHNDVVGIWTPGPYNDFFANDPLDHKHTPFLRIALHEFGHVMGLGDYRHWIKNSEWPYYHLVESKNPSDAKDGDAKIMWYDYTIFGLNETFRPFTILSSFDISEVRSLYGLSAFSVLNEFPLSSEGITAITADDNFAYLAAGQSGVIIIDIANPLNISQISTLTESGYANAVVKRDDLLFIAGAFNGINAYDISNPHNAVWKWNVGIGCIATNIDVSYPWVGFGGACNKLVNYSNPLQMYSTPFGPVHLGMYGAVAMTSEYLLAMDLRNGLLIYELTNNLSPIWIYPPSWDAPPVIGNIKYPELSLDDWWNVQIAIKEDGNRVFVADSRVGLMIIDIANPKAPVLLGTYRAAGIGKIAIDGNRVYAALANEVAIINVADPSSPNLIGRINREQQITDLCVNRDYLFVTEPNKVVVVKVK